jgi:flavin reductase (DIM6/NTAB) family NADH-FMN oxidoreductase RutF
MSLEPAMNPALRAVLPEHRNQVPRRPTQSTHPATASESDFRTAIGTVPTGVSVLTTQHPAGAWGITVGSLTSLSMTPPLLLVCLRTASTTLELLAEHGRFAISVLAAHQQRLADTFSRPRDHTSAASDLVNLHDLPVVVGAVAWLTCEHQHTYTGGDHAIVIGSVRHAQRWQGEPLVRHASRYRRLH